ncbi:MAG: nicotinate (nicotinamide) nucleotide adenylyltransferase [Bacteroidota bacterium]|nr:nicotinate (nicotinamide) nucleotide adenylyltransferase [Bacteroidota bacterium]
MERVGIFGGTFDPPHRAHLAVALQACDTLGLDRLLWIPAGSPPHKQGVALTEVHHRVEMTRLMTDEDSRFRLELGEALADGPSYTVATLERLHAARPDWQLFLVVGEDQLVAFPTWRSPERIRELVQLVVYRREGEMDGRSGQLSQQGGNQTEYVASVAPDVWLPGAPVPMASTAIRQHIETGEALTDELLPSVAEYIQEHRLYLPG